MVRARRLPVVAAGVIVLVGMVLLGMAGCSGSDKPSVPSPVSPSTTTLPADEQAANGPLVGDPTLVAGEQSCAHNEGNEPWYPTIAAFEVHDSNRTHLYDCAHFEGTMSNDNQVFAYSS